MISAEDQEQLTQMALARSMPVGLAHVVSDGDYQLARHIKILNQKLLDVAYGRTKNLIIMMPPRHSKCLRRDTPVTKASGVRTPIQEIVPGDIVICVNECYTKTVGKVTNISENGVKPVYRLTFHSGREIVCTDNHPFLTIDGWKEVKDLGIGQVVAALRQLPSPENPVDLPVGFAALIGYLVGDGAYNKTKSLVVTNPEPEVGKHLDEIVSRYGWEVHHEREGGISRRISTVGGINRDRSVTPPLERLREYLSPAKAATKIIPEQLFQAGDQDVKDFLAAYFNCDGTVNEHRSGLATYSSTSKELLIGTQVLLNRLGIYSYLRKHVTNYKGEPYTSYWLNIAGADLVKFSELVPVRGVRGEKLRRVAETIRGSNHYPEYDAIPDGWQKYLSIGKGILRTQHKIRIDKQYKIGTARQVVLKIAQLDNNQELLKLCSPDLIWDRITNIEYVGDEPTYDIEVDTHHNFSSDGLILHNSETTSKYFPAWFLGNFPKKRILLTSYQSEFAKEWGEKVRDLLDEWGEIIFGVRISPKKRRGDNFSIEYKDKNGNWKVGGYMKTAGSNGPLTGRGGDVIIIDDPVKGEKDARSKVFHEHQRSWWQTQVRTRQQKGAAVILILTRWTNNDIAGWLIEEMEKGGDQWEILSLPAICEDPEHDPLGRSYGEALWPEMFDEAYLAATKIASDIWWWALYQQTPQDREGGQFKYEWWQMYDPATVDYSQVVKYGMFIDSAFKTGVANDFSVIAHWLKFRDGTFKVARVFRKKMEFPDLMVQIHSEHRWGLENIKRSAQVYIEDKASGQSGIQTLSRPMFLENNVVLPRLPVVAWHPPLDPNMSKEARADRSTVFVKSGMVGLPIGADWVPDFKKEHAQFPKAQNDDMVDTSTSALLEYGNVADAIRFSVITLDKTSLIDHYNSEPQISSEVIPIASDPYYSRSRQQGW